jgi:hypothetical protein
MTTVPGTVTRVTDPNFPGSVEIVFSQTDGTTVAVDDKTPVFGVDAGPDTEFPVPVDMDCVVLPEDGEVTTVRLTHVDTELRVATKTVRR